MFVYLASFSCASQSIDIDSVVIKNIRNMHAVSTNQAADVCILTIMNQIPLVIYFERIILQVLRKRSSYGAKQSLLRAEIELCPQISSLPKVVFYEKKETTFLVYRQQRRIPGRSFYKKRDYSPNYYWDVFEISTDVSKRWSPQQL